MVDRASPEVLPSSPQAALKSASERTMVAVPTATCGTCGSPAVASLALAPVAGASRTSSTWSSKMPTLIRSPGFSMARLLATPFTWTPFVDIRSWMNQLPLSLRTTAWRRETEKSASTISFSVPRPMRSSSAASGRISSLP